MYNDYTLALTTRKEGSIEVAEAALYINIEQYPRGKPLGKLMQHNLLATKEDYVRFFTSIGNTIYGQEEKAAKETESFDTVLRLIETANSAGQEE